MLTIEEFIKRAREIHGDRYDYSKVDYKNNSTKVCIICPIHGEFWQVPKSHMKGCKCPMCANNIKFTNEDFIRHARQVHNDKYDYSKVEYKDRHTKVCIICKEHGEFWQRPSDHISNKQGCAMCGRKTSANTKKYNNDIFVEKIKKIFGNKYDYSKVEYKNSTTKVCIICPKHGEFCQRPDKLIQGKGCQKCNLLEKRKKLSLNEVDYITKVKQIHNNKYDYSKIFYENANSKLQIICPQHGEFWQTARNHLYLKNGCPLCKQSNLENAMEIKLQENKIKFIQQKRFKWLGLQSLDFYLPEYNIAIECQGIQHFDVVEHFGGEEKLKNTLLLDKRKKNVCEEHNIKVLYFSDLKIEYPYHVYTNIDELINKIKKNELL